MMSPHVITLADTSGRMEVRCPDPHRTLLARTFDFSGAASVRCRSCRDYVVFMTVDADSYFRLEDGIQCGQCGKKTGEARVTRGWIETGCKRCRKLTTTRCPDALAPVWRVDPTEIVATMEARWQEIPIERARRSAEIAVGLRFAVFTRDSYRCRYCGRSPEDGVKLHADHVTPESKGGPTTLENLVTACQDCNLGKSDHDIDPSLVIR